MEGKENQAEAEEATPEDIAEAKRAVAEARSSSQLLGTDELARLQHLRFEKKVKRGIEAVGEVFDEMGDVSTRLEHRRASTKVERKIKKGTSLEGSPK